MAKQTQKELYENQIKILEETIHDLQKKADEGFTASPLFNEMSRRLKYYEIFEKTEWTHLENEIRSEKADKETMKRLFDDNVALCRKHNAEYWIGLTEIDRYDKQRIHSLENDVRKLSAQVEAKDIIIKHLKDVIAGIDTPKPEKRGVGKPGISEDVKKRIRKMRRDGYALKDIADLEGISIGSVSAICKGIKKPKKETN